MTKIDWDKDRKMRPVRESLRPFPCCESEEDPFFFGDIFDTPKKSQIDQAARNEKRRKKRYRCPICNLELKNLKRHLKKVHDRKLRDSDKSKSEKVLIRRDFFIEKQVCELIRQAAKIRNVSESEFIEGIAEKTARRVIQRHQKRKMKENQKADKKP